MKEVLIITNYYPPEMGAASNRIFHLAEGLNHNGIKTSIVTPLPNYPKGEIFKDYRGQFKNTTVQNNITVHRLWLYASNSKNKLLRLFAMFSYSISLIWFFICHKIPKTVIIQSPPLLVAFTSVLFLRSKKRQLILNVSDLWPIAGLELGALKKGISYTILKKIEQFNYKHANLILGQSEEILNHTRTLFPKKETFLYRNFPSIKPSSVQGKFPKNKTITIVYAGLLGTAQGVYKLIQHLNFDATEFHIYGNGNEKEKISQFINANPNLPIFYHGEVNREKLHELILQYDIAIIPLLNRIYGSVPSKIFEYALLGMPLLYFGGGEGETIIKEHKLGWVANSSDYNDLNQIISSLKKEYFNTETRTQIQKTALKHFNFKSQLDELVKII